MKNLITLSILLTFLASCMPETPVTSVNSTRDNSTTDTDSGVDFNNEEEVSNTQWYSLGQYADVLTLDQDNTQIVYLRGSDVTNYLSNSANYISTYCMIIDFPSTATTNPNQLRVKAIPQKVVDYKTSQILTYYRINLSSSTGNDYCNIPTEKFDASVGNYVQTAVSATVANHPSTVCTSCLNILTSSKAKLYRYRALDRLTNSIPVLVPVEKVDINHDNLFLRINMNNNTNTEVGTCSNSECTSLGFDCCQNGQCVKEKAQISSGVSSDPSGFAEAELEKSSNPLWYLKYPQFYYSCLEKTPEDTDIVVDPENPQDEASVRLAALIEDYECINELIANAQVDPFHTDPITPSVTYNECNTSTLTDDMYYKKVMMRLYANCGCSESTYDDMVANCPAYTYSATLATDGTTINAINCVAPNQESSPTPFQDLEVTVNSRSAPHRFFDTTGAEISSDATVPDGASGIQEGDSFQYLDTAKLFPENGSFNMNSILGQMNVELSAARPAKLVDLEYDKTYYIAALEGYYTPCPSCAKDSWFQNFSAFPATNYGVGLQSIGYSTSRDSWSGNTTYGNYEDTIFGRACWVPPTMIPWSHATDTDAQDQRLNRLKTQAAFFMNGYQRDWFGFNKGALIGSFDGVTWFAIGKGRIVRSTTNKLFLAINAPFADLAQPTEHVVSVQEYDFITTGAKYDFDPNLSMNSPYQNEGATCQIHHECVSDSDCISALGWEYICADVHQLKTSWPVFDPETGNEVASQSKTGDIVKFLQGGEIASGSQKRCIYRGAGAPCVANYKTLGNESKVRAMACAPNFYCAGLNTNVYNNEVSRFAADLSELLTTTNHYYGQDANMLGRPRHYLPSSGSSLPTQVQSTIRTNINLFANSSTYTQGICRPGKSLSSVDPETQHRSKDSSQRTDYISQISSCNSTNYTISRHASCPVIDNNGNYTYVQPTYFSTNLSTVASQQNACGLESLLTGTSTSNTQDNLLTASPFKLVEAKSLLLSDNIIEPTMAADACLRRAGSVCHTNLDCYPNQMHADQVDLFSIDYFGNLAEQSFYRESLVCAQEEDVPNRTDADYDDYDISKNRCCRPIGESITMYTANTPNLDLTTGLETRTAGFQDPSNSNRYSRYAVAESTYPAVDASIITLKDETKAFQWATIHDTAQKTCCGGNWIRKFADGTNDWTKNRLFLDVNNFRCLNFQTPIVEIDLDINIDPWGAGGDNISSSQVGYDLARMCLDPSFEASGCAAVAMDPGSGGDFSLVPPTVNTITDPMILNTDLTQMAEKWQDNLWSYGMPQDIWGDSIPYLNWTLDADDQDIHINAKIRVPVWITMSDADTKIYLNDGVGARAECKRYTAGTQPNTLPAVSPADPKSKHRYYGGAGDTEDCYYLFNFSTRTLTVAPGTGGTFDPNAIPYATDIGIEFEFRAPGTAALTSIITPSSLPGNRQFYLNRLARFEYVGIPQMTYGAISCNTNYNKLVPGFFKDVETRAQFNSAAYSFGYTPIGDDLAIGGVSKAVTQENVDIEPIFDSSEFMCCRPLGANVDDASECCSGFGVTDSTTQLQTCKLPAGTDLNVYFNKFVSGEGVDEDLPVAALSLNDFDAYTGEPLSQTSVVQKLSALGEEYCENGTIRYGGAFGNYIPEIGGKGPSGGIGDGQEFHNIVDSVFDSGQHNNSTTGYPDFAAGFRWNHHVYCDI